jgi:hypothetical protein
MQKRFQDTLSSDDRAAIFSSLLAGVTYCRAIVLACVILAFATGHSRTDSSDARTNVITDVSTSMPL